jgi:hypothetical protein
MSEFSESMGTSRNGRNVNRSTRFVSVCLAGAFGLVPAAASAHEGSLPHVHPHGLASVTVLAGIVATGLVLRHLYLRHR